MARLFPSASELESLLEKEGRGGELRFLKRLEQIYEHEKDLLVFYSLKWEAPDRLGQLKNGEIDFLLVHPDWPLLILELKGGVIEYDTVGPQHWYSIDKTGQRNAIQSPFDQAFHNRKNLINRLVSHREFPQGWLPAAIGVVFPDSRLPDPFPPLSDPSVVLARDELLEQTGEEARRRIEVMRTRHLIDSANDPSAATLGYARYEFIRKRFTTRNRFQVPVGTQIALERESIDDRLESRKCLVQSLRENPKMRITGGAGSGKTTIATEKAVRFAKQHPDSRVLFTCYNERLSEHVHSRLQGLNEDVSSRLRVSAILPFFHECLESTGTSLDRPSDDDPGGLNLFYKTVVQRLYDLLTAADIPSLPRFDAIVVDEMQDFEEDWLQILLLLMRNPEGGEIYLFHDDAQSVRLREGGNPPTARLSVVQGMPSFELLENLRNTREIERFASCFRTALSEPSIEPHSLPVIQGRAPELIVVESNDGMLSEAHLRNQISRTLDRLLGDSPLHGNQATVLTGTSLRKSRLKVGDHPGRYTLVKDLHPIQNNSVLFETVRRFKGLDRPIVIVTELGNQPENVWYVAFTRAISHLVVLDTREVIERIRARLLERGCLETDPKDFEPQAA